MTEEANIFTSKRVEQIKNLKRNYIRIRVGVFKFCIFVTDSFAGEYLFFLFTSKELVIGILEVRCHMFTINIENNIVICVLIILMFTVIMYYIKRKFDSIDNYIREVSDKLKTYKENQAQYKQNLKDIGLSNKEIKLIGKILKLLTDKNEE